MPNPGSPQSMQEMQQQAPPMNTKTMIGMFAVLIVMMVVMQFRSQIGGALDVVLNPIAFDGKYPVVTLVIAGVIMISVSTLVRRIQSDFNKEFRQARLENNLFKMKKLQEMQPQIMAMSMEASTQQMKVMPISMIVLLPMYAWIWYFINPADAAIPGGNYFGGDGSLSGLEHALANIPWAPDFDLNTTLLGFIPAWIVIYSMVSMPIGQIENRLLRLYFLRKHLRKLDLEAKRAEIE